MKDRGIQHLREAPDTVYLARVDLDAIVKATLRAIGAATPIVGALLHAFDLSIDRSVKAVESGEIDQIRQESGRQELELAMTERQARVAQEIAIARRIETAEQVEMEEYYDYSGRGHVGGLVDESQVSIGVGGAGRRVSKRVYRFTGTARKTRKAKAKPTEDFPAKVDGAGEQAAEPQSGEAGA